MDNDDREPQLRDIICAECPMMQMPQPRVPGHCYCYFNPTLRPSTMPCQIELKEMKDGWRSVMAMGMDLDRTIKIRESLQKKGKFPKMEEAKTH